MCCHTEIEVADQICYFTQSQYRLVGLVVKTPASRAENPEFESRSHLGDFSGSSYTSDFKIGAPVATLPGIIGSVLGLIGPCLGDCDWVR